jgi:hypothetical protein
MTNEALRLIRQAVVATERIPLEQSGNAFVQAAQQQAHQSPAF